MPCERPQLRDKTLQNLMRLKSQFQKIFDVEKCIVTPLISRHKFNPTNTSIDNINNTNQNHYNSVKPQALTPERSERQNLYNLWSS